MAQVNLDQDSFVPFSHSAAGHQGISSNASGTIIIKPCTQAEIDFYTLASTDPSHAAFYAHMPHFFGSLKASPNQEQLKTLLQTTSNEGVTGPTPELAKEVKDAPPNVGALTPSHTQAQEKQKKEEKVLADTWQPSGGKKLSTGLMLAISNAAAGITRPCVLDVKLGARLWDDGSPVAKRQKLDEVSNSTTSGSLGFRVAGMKVWVGDEQQEKEEHCEIKDGYKTYDKFYGRDFTKETVQRAFESFIGGVEGGKLKRKHAKLVLDRLTREVESIEYTLQNEESRMYSASILMVYDGDGSALERALEIEKKPSKGNVGEEANEEEEEEDDDDDEAEPKVHDVCLIDFAHAKFEAGLGPDENALQGVRSVLSIMKALG